MPDKTMQQAANELHAAVIALRELVEREYPSRSEVENRFASKAKSTQRWYLLIVLILASAFISFLSTVTTVSACFLGDPSHPKVCEVLPGYKQSEQRSRDLVELLTELQKVTLNNDARLDQLDKSNPS